MRPLQFSVDVTAPVDRVFNVFIDLPNLPIRVGGIERIELLTDRPVQDGTRFRETRIMFGREATEEMEVRDCRPPETFTLHCESCGAVWDSTYRFSPNGTGTRVELDMACRPASFIARLMAPVSGLMAGGIKKAVRQDLEDLKRSAEAGPEVAIPST